MALAGDRLGALRGLAILSAGARHGPKVDLKEFVKQRESLNTGLMTIGKWMGTHPTLSERMLALDDTLNAEAKPHRRGPIMALVTIVSAYLILILAAFGMMSAFDMARDVLSSSATQ